MDAGADFITTGASEDADSLLDAVFERAPIGLVLFDTEFRFLRINARLAEINGYSVEAHVGRSVEDLLPGSTAGLLHQLRPRLMRGESVEEVEFDSQDPKTGHTRWWVVSYTPLRGKDGSIRRFLGMVREVTERKRAQLNNQLLLREVNHRSKNLLSLVQSVARQSARGGADPAAFLPRFEARLAALAASQDLLVRESWSPVDLEQLARAQLAHLGEALGTRMTLSGPLALVAPEAAQNLSMAIHELATNAAKHGALSGMDGRARLSWEFDETDGRLAIEWRETDGPLVSPPSRRGFGTMVVTTLVQEALAAEVTLDFAPEGLVWRMVASAGLIAPARAPGGERPAVLLCCADPAARALAGLISAAGYDVLGPASEAADALSYLGLAARCDAAIIDADLPGEDGCGPIAEALTRRRAPFVVMTSADPQTLPAAMQGAPGLSKPADPRAALALLEAVIERAAGRKASAPAS